MSPTPCQQEGTHTHLQALQVTAKARAFHIDEGLWEKHKGDVTHPWPWLGCPEAQGCCLGGAAASRSSVAPTPPHPTPNPRILGGTHQLVMLGGGSWWSRGTGWSRGSSWPHTWVTLAERRDYGL